MVASIQILSANTALNAILQLNNTLTQIQHSPDTCLPWCMAHSEPACRQAESYGLARCSNSVGLTPWLRCSLLAKLRFWQESMTSPRSFGGANNTLLCWLRQELPALLIEPNKYASESVSLNAPTRVTQTPYLISLHSKLLYTHIWVYNSLCSGLLDRACLARRSQ